MTSGFNAPQIHHIIGGHSRENVLTNLVTVCRVAHDWCHADPIAGKIACWRAKLEKGEFEPHVIEVFWGRSVAGYLQEQKVVNRCAFGSVLNMWRHTLITACEDMLGGR